MKPTLFILFENIQDRITKFMFKNAKLNLIHYKINILRAMKMRKNANKLLSTHNLIRINDMLVVDSINIIYYFQ